MFKQYEFGKQVWIELGQAQPLLGLKYRQDFSGSNLQH